MMDAYSAAERADYARVNHAELFEMAVEAAMGEDPELTEEEAEKLVKDSAERNKEEAAHDLWAA